MEKKMEREMEAGDCFGVPHLKLPMIGIIILGPKP